MDRWSKLNLTKANRHCLPPGRFESSKACIIRPLKIQVLVLFLLFAGQVARQRGNLICRKKRGTVIGGRIKYRGAILSRGRLPRWRWAQRGWKGEAFVMKSFFVLLEKSAKFPSSFIKQFFDISYAVANAALVISGIQPSFWSCLR